MTTSVMFMSQSNATASVLTDATILQGKDYSLKVVKRTLSDIDVGADAGKTQHSQGALCFTPSGCVVKAVLSVSVFNANAVTMTQSSQVASHIRADGSIAIRDVIPQGGNPFLGNGNVVMITFVTGPKQS